jgi:pre-rRNA-processing protein TSR3
MRSSGNTRSPRRDGPIRLLLVLAGEDHPKSCTGRRLIHRGLAHEVRNGDEAMRSPVVLDPYAAVPLAAADRASAVAGGFLVVDCSWNRLTERGGFPGRAPRGVRRRLPLLIATNPQHYGRLAQLNTVEALAAALYLVGRPEEARRLLEGFRGADQFLSVNAERLTAYAGAEDADGVRTAERRLFGGGPPC